MFSMCLASAACFFRCALPRACSGSVHMAHAGNAHFRRSASQRRFTCSATAGGDDATFISFEDFEVDEMEAARHAASHLYVVATTMESDDGDDGPAMAEQQLVSPRAPWPA